MPKPVYILSGTPGAEGRTVKWEAIYRKKHKLFITYEPYRDTSRWKHVERKRKFAVYFDGYTCKCGTYATLEAAEKAAFAFANT